MNYALSLLAFCAIVYVVRSVAVVLTAFVRTRLGGR